MTDERLAKLPALAREIILADRKLDEMRKQPALPMKEMHESIVDVRRLRAAAAQNWGPRSSGEDGKRRG